MKKLILLLVFFSCCEIPDKQKQPEYSYAKVVVDASPNNEWEIGFIVSQGDANSLILSGNSDVNTHTKFIYKDSPFIIIMNFKKFNNQAVISTFIDDVKKESVTLNENPFLPVVILYTNNDTKAARALLEEIKFESKTIIIQN